MQTQIYEWKLKLKSISPLFIGDNDQEVMTDQNDQPMIPGTSLAGVCRAYLENSEFHNLIDDLFGKSATYRPHEGLSFSDGISTEQRPLEVRTGVSISGFSKSAIDGQLFERTYVQAGTVFDVLITLKVDKNEKSSQLAAVKYMLNGLKHGIIRLGAYQSTGAGKFTIESYEYRHFDCTNSEDLIAFVEPDPKKRRKLKKPEKYLLDDTFAPQSVIRFSFKGETATPLLIGTTNVHDSNKPDKTFMTTMHEGVKKPVVPGTSIKGVLRHRVERITNIMGLQNKSDYLTFLFGQAKDTGEPQAGTLRFNDILIENESDNKGIKIYHRTSINPLTGSVRKGVVIEEETVIGNFATNIHLYKKQANSTTDAGSVEGMTYTGAALLLFALRDLALQQISL